MTALENRRILIAAGAGAAVLAGVLIAVFASSRGANTPPPPPAAKGSLQVEMTADQARQDPARPLRCFVGGQFIGQATLAECAQRNGVAAQALDVGLDQSGALAAGGEAAQLQPLPPGPIAPQVAANARQNLPPLSTAIPAIPIGVPTTTGPGAECLRYGAEGWRSMGAGMGLSACVQLLFDGRCERPGEALYGRWSGQTLRLVPGRVESSGDNRDFHMVVEQNPRDCTIPPL